MAERGEISVCYTMRFERTSKHSAARLWHAITDPDELAAWWKSPNTRVDLRVGGEHFVEFSPEFDGNLDGIIIRVESERRLTYVWGVSLIDWQISDTDNACSFSFTHHGQPPGQVEQEGGIAGGYDVGFEWLEARLDGRDYLDVGDELWQKRTTLYTKRIHAVIGEST